MTIWNEILACSMFHSLLVFQLQPMTNYHLTPSSPLSSFATQEAKAKRRQVLARAAQTRRANYQRFLRRMAYLQRPSERKNVACKQAELCYNQFTMSNTLTPIDISTMPELTRIVEEVAATKTPRELKRNNEIVAVLTPVKTEGKQQNKKAIEETLALAGSWKDLDFDDMIQELDRIRHESKPTSPLELDL